MDYAIQVLTDWAKTQVSFYPDSDLVPTQPIRTVSTADIARTVVQDMEQKMCLSQKKALQIEEFSRMQIPALARGTENLTNGLVKCQCGWDGEELAMVCSVRRVETG